MLNRRWDGRGRDNNARVPINGLRRGGDVTTDVFRFGDGGEGAEVRELPAGLGCSYCAVAIEVGIDELRGFLPECAFPCDVGGCGAGDAIGASEVDDAVLVDVKGGEGAVAIEVVLAESFRQDYKIDKICGAGLGLIQHSATVVITVGCNEQYIAEFIGIFSIHGFILNLSTASLNCRFFPCESPRNGKDFLGLCPSLIAENRSHSQSRSVRLFLIFMANPDALPGISTKYVFLGIFDRKRRQTAQCRGLFGICIKIDVHRIILT